MPAGVLIARGVEQGCPTSGSIWAVASDPIIRSASHVVLTVGGSLSAFVDDLSAASRDIVQGLSVLAPLLDRMRLAAGLRLNYDKTSITNCGSVDNASLQTALLVGLALLGVTLFVVKASLSAPCCRPTSPTSGH